MVHQGGFRHSDHSDNSEYSINCSECKMVKLRIQTPDAFDHYTPLAERLQPLGHLTTPLTGAEEDLFIAHHLHCFMLLSET